MPREMHRRRACPIGLHHRQSDVKSTEKGLLEHRQFTGLRCGHDQGQEAACSGSIPKACWTCLSWPTFRRIVDGGLCAPGTKPSGLLSPCAGSNYQSDGAYRADLDATGKPCRHHRACRAPLGPTASNRSDRVKGFVASRVRRLERLHRLDAHRCRRLAKASISNRQPQAASRPALASITHGDDSVLLR